MGFWDPSDNLAGYHTNLDSVHPRWMRYNFDNFSYMNNMYYVKQLNEMDHMQLFLSFSFILEFVFTSILLAGVFTITNVSKSWKPIVIGIGVWIAVALGIRTGNFSINPARMVGPAIAHDVMIRNTNVGFSAAIDSYHYASWISFYLIPQLGAGLMFAYIERKKLIKSKKQ